MLKLERGRRASNIFSQLISHCHPLPLSCADFLALREIDIDLNMKVSFIEYCLYK